MQTSYQKLYIIHTLL